MKINFNDKKYLVTSGCSYTDGYSMGETGSWAYYLSNIVNLELHNKARGGQGNEFIANSVITYLINNEEILENCVVGVAWSETTRLMSSIFDLNVQRYLLDTVRPQDFLEDGRYNEYIGGKIFFCDIPYCIYKTYMSIINLSNFLNYYNIPHFYVDAINNTKVDIVNEKITMCTTYDPGTSDCMEFDLSKFPTYYSTILNENINNKIFNNFIKIGKYDSLIEFIFSDYEKYEKGNSGHPNNIAAREIAELMYNELV